MKKGQVATEYMILIGIAFFILIPIFYYSLTSSSQSIRMNEASNFVDIIAKTSDVVYAMGPGSQDYIEVSMPGGVESVSFSGKEINLRVKIYGNISDVYANSKADLIGNISTSSGIKHIYIKSLDNGTIEVTD